jgi:Cu/Ag efflux protein CusF
MTRNLIPLIALALILGTAHAAFAAAENTKMIGTISDIDKGHKFFTLKADHDEQAYRFEVPSPAVVNKLKKGQHVEVVYRKGNDPSRGSDSQLFAESVVDKPRKAAAKKK